MARLVKMLSAGASVAWVASVSMVVLRATEALGSWATTATVVSVGAGTTLTMAAVFAATVPGMLQTWHEGIAYGRRLEREGVGLPSPRRHLTTVR